MEFDDVLAEVVALLQTAAVVGHEVPLPLLAQAEETVTTSGLDRPLRMAYASEAHLLTGCPEDASPLALGLLEFSQTHRGRRGAAYALRLLGDLAMHRAPAAIDQAESHYQQALTLTQELGILVPMRIEGAGDEGVAAHDFPHAAGDVGLGPRHAAHAHRAMEREIDAVPSPTGLELGDHAPEKVLVGLRRDPA